VRCGRAQLDVFGVPPIDHVSETAIAFGIEIVDT
jgi:hypothetical protein